ncbi:MAG: response regulator [Deltaproteobacteria bacterium]|nr:response regulator [Deltaproteobacteria bacterium]
MPKKILLADDSITIQKVIAITFAAESYELTIVGDGDSAVKKAREIAPDLVMADVAMPGKTGYEVCEAIKKDPQLKNTPVLLLAGTFEPLNKDEALRAGADDSIVKPFESQELLDKVKDLLDKAEARQRAVSAPVVAPVQQAAPEARTLKAEQAPEDIWHAGDFLGFTDEPEKAEFKPEEVPDLDFLDTGFFEEPEKPAQKAASTDRSMPREKDFFDLEFKEEEIVPEKAPKEASKDEFFGGNFDFSTNMKDEAKPEPFEVGPIDFESFKQEPKKEEPASADFETLSPFETAPVETLEAPESKPKPFWAGDLRDDEKVPFAEPELIENEEPIVEETPSPGRFFEQPKEEPRFEVPKFEETAFEPPIFELPPPLSREPLRPVVEDRPLRAEAIAVQAVSAATIRTESRQEPASARLEERIREAAQPKVEGIPISREEAEAIVRKVAREVIEEVAWEVIPDLAEELIRAEIAKAKEAIFKLK